VLIADGCEVQPRLATGRLFALGAKNDDVATIFPAAEKEETGVGVAQTRDSVFARRKSSAGGYERKWDLDYDLILGVSFRGSKESRESD